MIGLTFTVDNINTVLQIYNQIQVIRYDPVSVAPPPTPSGQPQTLMDWTVVSGTASYPVPINLVTDTTYYMAYDPVGESSDWFSSRYYSSVTGSYSGWSEPILGAEGDLYYDPIYDEEQEFTSEEQTIIDRIRLYIGDPLGIRREAGEESIANLHPDGKTYELSQKGWPVSITVGGQSFTDKLDPSVNGYRYLKFQGPVDDICSICLTGDDLCGEEVTKNYSLGIDIWYYTFRNSDRQILEAYDSCPPPPGLTMDTATTESYILQTAIDLIRKELLEDSTEDGASIKDEGSTYNPEPGLKAKKGLLDDLQKRLDDLIKSLAMKGISGVLID